MRRRRMIAASLLTLATLLGVYAGVISQQAPQPLHQQSTQVAPTGSAIKALDSLEVKGRAAKTGYSRSQFGNGWEDLGACDVRNYILRRDMTDVRVRSETDCTVESGTLADLYTGKTIAFARGAATSDDVQIDHVVALSDAWQKGAQQLPAATRRQFANDPLNLLAVDGKTNQDKGDADAATWLPPNKGYRCQYVARQIAVKQKYKLWVTAGERDAMRRTLDTCPDQQLPVVIQP